MIYEYLAKDKNKSCKHCKSVFEVMQSITSEPLTHCPKCDNEIEKQVSLPAGHITPSRQMNQFNDVKKAKYWRDKNGIKHKVTDADGMASSPTVSNRVTASPEQIAARKKADDARTKQRLSKIRHVWRKK